MRLRFNALIVAFLPFAFVGSSAALAQSIMSSPTINIPSRTPNINSNLTGRVATGVGGNSFRVRPPCSAAYRESNGDCSDQPVAAADGSGKPAVQAPETADTGMARAPNPPAIPAVSVKPGADEIKPAA